LLFSGRYLLEDARAQCGTDKKARRGVAESEPDRQISDRLDVVQNEPVEQRHGENRGFVTKKKKIITTDSTADPIIDPLAPIIGSDRWS